MYGSPHQEPINGDKVNTLLRIFWQNYCTVSNVMLARMCHTYFKEQIYKPMRSRGQRVPMWRTRHILVHFETHIEEPRLFIGESIRRWKRVQQALHTKLFKEVKLAGAAAQGMPGAAGAPPDTVIVVDKDNVRLALAVQKTLTELYKTKPGPLNFYSEACGIDFSRAGQLINVHKDWQIR